MSPTMRFFKQIRRCLKDVLNYQKVWKLWLFFTILIFFLNPLTANDELSRLENLTFLWIWILRWVPRSFATHASLSNTLSSNKLCPKTVKIPVDKVLNCQKVRKLWLFFTILIFLFKLSKSMKIVTFFHNFNIFV